MIILGLNISGFHSSACLIANNKIQYAITEERLSRIKQDKNFPHKAIKYCCENYGIGFEDIDHIYIGWNPSKYMFKSNLDYTQAMRERSLISHFALNELSTLVKGSFETQQILKLNNKNITLNFIDHHKAHLYNAFFQSGFDHSDFLILDGFGENTTGFIGTYNNQIEIYNNFNSPHSLGSFYSAFTEFLGFKPNGDEWKIMALAALGNSDKYYHKVKSLINVNNLNFELDLSYFNHYQFFSPNYFSEKFIKKFGNQIIEPSDLTKDHYDLVASVQLVAEETTVELLNNLQSKTGCMNLIVGGGFFMNSVLNGKLESKTNYKNLYIGGSPDDSGVSIGSALFGNNQKINKLNHNFFGKEYHDFEIKSELEKRKINYKKVENITKVTANFLRNGNIIGWFQGKSEFGQRALGNRSILADPGIKNIKDKINNSIKYRELFRPFAPSILEEYQNKYFPNNINQTSYFMEKVFKFDPSLVDKIKGVVHFDGTGRLQTVSKKTNKLYHKLINEFYKLSGYPIILNTSLNINGMPLVESPSDALDCFFQSGLDILIMNNYIIKKEKGNTI